MKYYLIITIIQYYTTTIHSIEFNNQEACVAAQHEYLKANSFRNLSAVCVSKGAIY